MDWWTNIAKTALLLTIFLDVARSQVDGEINYRGGEEKEGSSVSGPLVSCYHNMENCREACWMTCYFADHCNDSHGPMVGCAPGLGWIVFVTLFCVICLCGCCTTICLCSPCCFCAIWLKNRISKRNRENGAATKERSDFLLDYPGATAPPLSPKKGIV